MESSIVTAPAAAFLRLPAIFVSLTLLASIPGTATAAEPAMEEIVVYGQALAMDRAIDAKRSVDNVLDAASQDDMGKLPDLNTAAVVRRLPGLGVQNDQAEARFAVVRGLNPSYNRTTLNSAPLASPERGSLGRAIPLDVIPASLLSRLEVYKTMTPDMDANAIGGTINMVTRSALDADEPFFYGAAFLGNHEQSGDGGTLSGTDEKQPWRANAAGGFRFGNEDQFGVVAAIDYSLRNFEIPQIEVDDADYTEFDAAGNNVGLGNGNGIVVPTNNRIFFYNNERERIGASLAFEWAPSDQLELSLGYTHTEFNDDERRDENLYELGTSGSSSQPDMIRNQSVVGGITDTGYGIVGLGRFTLDREIDTLAGAVRWDLSDFLTLDVRSSYSDASLSNPESTETFQTDTTHGSVFDITGFYPRSYPLDAEAYYDLSAYVHQNRGELDRYVDDTLWETAVDLTLAEAFGMPLELKAGGLYRDLEKEEGFVFNRYQQNAGLNYSLENVPDTELADTDFQGNYKMAFRVDSAAAEAFYKNNSASFSETFTTSSQTNATEEVTALYGMGTYRTGRFTVIGGVRWEQTDWSGDTLAAQTGVSGDYDNALFGLHTRFDATENLVLRAAFSQTIGRADLSQLTQGETINLADQTISRSNPDLEPRQANNLDFSVEYYIPNGILAATVFYKDVKDEIFTVTSSTTLNGQTFQLTQPENAEDAEILGAELQYSQTFTFLPAPLNDLGLSANATLLDTTYRVPTSTGTREIGYFQQPDLVVNTSIFYAGETFEARLSYNWTDEFIDTIVPEDKNRDEYWDEREQLDLQLRLNVTPKLSVLFEAVNLTDDGRRELTGPGHAYLQEDASFGRTFWFGVNYSY